MAMKMIDDAEADGCNPEEHNRRYQEYRNGISTAVLLEGIN
jgi:hypothetical protein